MRERRPHRVGRPVRLAAFLAFAAAGVAIGVPSASATQPSFRTGTYKAVAVNAGIVYDSTWTLTVSAAGKISGKSTWTCCPGKRLDPLSGTVKGTTVVIHRDCTKQGYVGPCNQTYTGTIGSKGVVTGTWSGTGAVSGSTFSLTRT